MEFSVLGALRIEGPEGLLEVRGVRERLLLAHLLVGLDRPVPVGALIDGLWGQDPPRTATKALQNVVMRVRRTLEPVRAGSPGLLVTEPGGYRLVADGVRLDARAFEERLREATGLGGAERVAVLTEALALWRGGSAYAGLSARLVSAEARRLEELRAAAEEDLRAAQLEAGVEPGTVVAELEGLVRREPLRERSWGLLMTALYRQGRQGDALAAFDRARDVLADELGLDPGPELRRLHARLLAQDATLGAAGGWPAQAPDALARRERLVVGVSDAARAADEARTTWSSARAALSRTVLDLRSADAATRSPSPDCPWPGLAAYGIADGAWFAGRERLVAELAARVATDSCVTVLGASGSGKSSLVHGGLLAGLADDLLPGSSAWTLLTMRPGPHPVSELARLIIGVRRPDVGDLLERLVRQGEGALAQRTVLVVDQLEETWTLCDDESERAAFLEAVGGLVGLAEGGVVTVVLVLRADFLSRLADHEGVAEAAAETTVLVGTPTPDAVRRAVTAPAHRAGLLLEEGLADALVEDAGQEPGLLPLLSTTLRRLWEAREGARLSLAAYVDHGGLRGAIAHAAEDEFATLPPEQQADAKVLFLRLSGPVEGGTATRRRVGLAVLSALPHDVSALVGRFARARLLTVSDGYVEVAHEALFQEWPRLRGWLEEDREGRAVQRRLTIAAGDWSSENRDPALLWSGHRLASAIDVAAARPGEVSAIEREFLLAAQRAAADRQRESERRAAEKARQNRWLRTALAAAAVLLLVTTLAGCVAWLARGREAESARAAARSATSAEARRLAATALTMEQPDLALLSAVEATRVEPDPETYGAVLTLLARQPDVVTRVRTDQRFFSVVADPMGRRVFLGENAPVLRAVDARTGAPLWRRDDLRGQPAALAVSPDGALLAVVTWAALDGTQDTLTLLDPVTGADRTVVALDRLAPGAPGLWGGAGWIADDRLVLATDQRVLVVDRAGRVVRSVAWQRPVADAGSFVVWPDGRVSVGANPAGPPVLLDLRRPRAGSRRLRDTVWAVSPDATRVAATRTTTTGEQLVVLDGRTLRPASKVWPLTGGAVESVRYSRDGQRIVVAGGERLEVRDGRSGTPLLDLRGHGGGISAAAFAGRDRVWSASRDSTAVGFDTTGREGTIATRPSPDAPWNGEAAGDRVIWTMRNPVGLDQVWLRGPGDGRGRRLALTGLAGCRCDPMSTDLTPDGTVASVGVSVLDDRWRPRPDRGRVVVWDAAHREVRARIDTPWPVWAVDSSPSGDRLVVNGGSGWGVVDLGTQRLHVSGESWAPWTRLGIGTAMAEVAPDGRHALLLRGRDALLVDLDTRKTLVERRVETDDTAALMSAAWAPDGRTVAVGSAAGRFFVLDGHTLATVRPVRAVTSGVLVDVEVSPDGRVAATLGPEGDLTLWDVPSWRPFGGPLFDDGTNGLLRFMPDSARLEAWRNDGVVASVATRPADWVAAACAAAHREPTAREWALLRPGVRQHPVCG